MPTVTEAEWQKLVAAITRRQFGIGLGAAAITAFTSSCSGSDSPAATEGTRTIAHAMGTTEVGSRPSRVVALDSLPIDTVVSLGLKPVGAAQAGSADTLPPYLGDSLAETTVVGDIAEPNLESIAALRPDLILSSKQRHGALYEALSEIAPTVFSESPAVDWRGTVRLFADALGELEQAEDALALFVERARTVGEQIESAGRTAYIIRVMDEGVRLHGPGTFAGSVLTAAGFEVTGLPWDEKNDMYELSFELIDQVDSDIAFIANRNPPGDLGLSAALVGQLGASNRDGVHQVDYAVWITGIGLAGANQILDSLKVR